jgi:adenosylmethionine-8-amino-7-oxononanoate aminotransferase
VLARWGSYHGNTLGALDASGRPGLREGFEPWLGRFEHLPAVNEYRCANPEHPAECGRWHADRLEEAVLRIGAERVAAFIAEPIGGATTGATVPPADYWQAVRSVCDRHGILLIADEVMTGFGRTGRWFGLDHWDVTADIVLLAKGMASGYWPLGACVASKRVADVAADRFRHGHTYSHHPAGAAAALAVLDIIERERLVERSAAMGDLLRGMLGERLGGHPHVGDVRGTGLLVAIELVADPVTGDPFKREAATTERVRSAMINRGVIPYPVTGCADGVRGDGLLLGPPLVIDDEQLRTIVDATDAALAETF